MAPLEQAMGCSRVLLTINVVFILCHPAHPLQDGHSG